MPLDPAMIADALYGPDAQLIDELLEVNAAESLIRVRMPTHDDLPLTRDQRVHPVRHPRHVSGGLMVHMTGVAAYVHAYQLLGLRTADGWTGYGVRIHHARFVKLAPPGPPVEITCKSLQTRRMRQQIYARYAFTFKQAGEVVFESEQSAMWLKPELAGANQDDAGSGELEP